MTELEPNPRMTGMVGMGPSVSPATEMNYTGGRGTLECADGDGTLVGASVGYGRNQAILLWRDRCSPTDGVCQ
jgi:hypothetical protein